MLLELDALSQGQLLGVVDGTGGPPHVLLPGVTARLPTTARRLIAAERPADLCPVGGDVYVDDAAVRAFRAQPLRYTNAN